MRFITGTRQFSNIDHSRRLRFPAELLLLRAKRQTGCALLNDDARYTARPGFSGARHYDVNVGYPAARNECLGAIEHIVVAVATCAGRQIYRIGPGVGLRQTIACEVLHGAQLWQEFPARLGTTKGIDHPGRHVVDRDIGRGRCATLCQLLKDQCGVETAQCRSAHIFIYVYAAKTERRGLAQGIEREKLVLIPFPRMRHQFIAGKRASGRLESQLFFGEVKVHYQHR